MEISSQMIAVFCILAFTIVMMVWHIIPYGVTAMTACVLLALTGVVEPGKAFAGLTNTTTMVAATMFVIAKALGKTSYIQSLSDRMMKKKKKSDLLILLMFVVYLIIMSQVMGQLPCIMLTLVLIQSIKDDTKLSTGKMLFFVCMISTIWSNKIPFAHGATTTIIANSYIQNLVAPENLLKVWDVFKVGIIPAVVGSIYCMFAHPLLPDRDLEDDVVEKKEVVRISKKDDRIILAIFLVVTAGFMATDIIGAKLSNLLPVIAVLALIYTKCITVKEAVAGLTVDLIWMIGGIVVLQIKRYLNRHIIRSLYY